MTKLRAEPRGRLRPRLEPTTPGWFLATLGRSWGGLSLRKGWLSVCQWVSIGEQLWTALLKSGVPLKVQSVLFIPGLTVPFGQLILCSIPGLEKAPGEGVERL